MSTATEVKERPIIFSAESVRAILSGAKTQTRRVFKPTPPDDWCPIVGPYHPRMVAKDGEEYPGDEVFGAADNDFGRACRYGAPGEYLWVKEAWATLPLNKRFYRADGEMHGDWKWRPSLFMPRLASRLTLEIVAVRVERLNDITEADAKAEGIRVEYLPPDPDNFHPPGSYGYVPGLDPEETIQHTRREAYAVLWDHINGKTHTWSSNPWVWVVEFKRIEP
jgi:hypothetical protein